MARPFYESEYPGEEEDEMAKWTNKRSQYWSHGDNETQIAVWCNGFSWYGRFYPGLPIPLRATNAEDAKVEIAERARAILTEALAALPKGRA